jgi:hypothetical protein
MSSNFKATAIGVLACITLAASAQDFPEGATELKAADIASRLTGKVFDVRQADGVTWRLEYNSSGYFFIDTSRGFRSSGVWNAEDGKLCGKLQGRDRTCNAVRLYQDHVHYARDSGEVVRLVPR